jgi:hypothetical protein
MKRRASGALLVGLGIMSSAIAQSARTQSAGGAREPSIQEPAAQQPGPPPARFDFGGNAAEVPAEFQSNLIFLPVRVNGGQPSLFELDTTTAFSSMDPARGAELGLTASTEANGQGLVENPVLEMPGLRLPMRALPFFERKGFDAQVGQHYQGTLGRDFLDRVVVEIDYQRRTVRLYDPAVYTYQGKFKPIPLDFLDDAPLVKAKFDAPAGKTYEADFELSTSVDDSIVFSSRYEDSHHLVTGHLRTIPAYRPEWPDSTRNALGRLKQFQLGPGPAVDTPLAVFSQKKEIIPGHPNVAGIIGGGFLRRFTVILDYPHHQVILEPHRLYNEYEEADMSGLSLIAAGNNLRHFEVVDVQPGSPAASARIRLGDVIAGVDDEPAADLSLGALRNLFRQIPHKYKIVIERNDKTIDLQVSMHRLL